MPANQVELIKLIDEAIVRHPDHGDPISGGRQLFLQDVRRLIGRHGLPLPDRVRLGACLMPFIGQELIYDDYDYSLRTTDLGHLGDMVEIDVIVWSGGLRRSELTDQQYGEYLQFCHRAMEFRTNRKY